MDLYWAKYSGQRGHQKWLLLLILEATTDKLYCINADLLSPEDKEFIRDKASHLDSLTLEQKIAEFKEVRPSVIKNFMTIYINNLIIDKKYKIK